MRHRSAALIWDLERSLTRIQRFVDGKSFEDYDVDILLRSAMERQFEIAGEAMTVLRRSDPETAAEVPELRRIVALRNILIHGYAKVNNLTVWRTATEDLDAVLVVARELLRSVNDRSAGDADTTG